MRGASTGGVVRPRRIDLRRARALLDCLPRLTDNFRYRLCACPEAGMISFLCSHCGAPLRMRPEVAGATKQCPRGHKPVQAPQESDAGGGTSSTLSRPAPVRDSRPTFETASAARDDDL